MKISWNVIFIFSADRWVFACKQTIFALACIIRFPSQFLKNFYDEIGIFRYHKVMSMISIKYTKVCLATFLGNETKNSVLK